MDEPVVVGLDISLTATGIARSDGYTTTLGKAGITTLPLAERDHEIGALALDITLLVPAATRLVVIEAPAFSRARGGAHERAGLWWRVVRLLIGQFHLVAEVKPNLRALYATGRGNADKGAVVDAVARRWPNFHTGGNDNIADAVVLVAMGRDHLGKPMADMPKTHRAALDKVAWPEVTT